eukprot:75110-Prymnesium_polylepis.2
MRIPARRGARRTRHSGGRDAAILARDAAATRRHRSDDTAARRHRARAQRGGLAWRVLRRGASPVRVKNDARVGRDEVDAQPARARRQQEDINRLVRVEIVHRLPALVVADGAVEPAEAHALPRE